LCALATKDLSNSGKASGDTSPLRLVMASIFLAAFSLVAFRVTVKLAVSSPTPVEPAAILAAAIWTAIVGVAILYWLNKIQRPVFCMLLVCVAIFDGLTTLYIARPTLYTSNELMRSMWREVDARRDASLSLSSAGMNRDLDPPASLSYQHPAINRNNRNLSLKVAVMQSDMVMWNRFYKQMEIDPALAAFALGPNRIWFTAGAPVAPANDDNFAVYVQRVKQSGTPVVILHSPSQMLEISRSVEGSANQQPAAALDPNAFASAWPAQVSNLSYWPNSLSLRYTAHKAGWLIVTDRWAPGWRVTVNSKPQEVMGADFVFRAVKVEPGENVIEFRYRPFGWPYLLIVSWGTLLLVAVLDILRLARARFSGPHQNVAVSHS
jgi:hypothetical protein